MGTRKTVHLDIDDQTWNQFKGKAAVTGMTVAGLIKSYVVNYAEVGTTGTMANVKWEFSPGQENWPKARPSGWHRDPTEVPDDDRR